MPFTPMESEAALPPTPEHPTCSKCGTSGAMKIKLGATLHPKHPDFLKTPKIVLNLPQQGLVGTYSLQHVCEDCYEQTD